MPTFSCLHIPNHLLEEMITHAREALPNECCGLLAGRVANEIGIATVRFAIVNDLASPTAYHTNAADLFAAFRTMRAAGTEVLAVYHSHPSSAPIPSRRDVEENTYGETVVHLIVGWARVKPEVRGWWLMQNEFREAAFVLGASAE